MVASWGMSPFVEDSIIEASGRKENGKKYRNVTRASDKNRSRRGGYHLWANHTSTEALKSGLTLHLVAYQPWSEWAWYPVGNYGIATGDKWDVSCEFR